MAASVVLLSPAVAGIIFGQDFGRFGLIFAMGSHVVRSMYGKS